MLDKDKIFLVIEVGGKTPEEAFHIIKNLKMQVDSCFDDTVKTIFIPNLDEDGIKIECINPVLLDAELYKEVEEKTKKAVELIDKFINNEG